MDRSNFLKALQEACRDFQDDFPRTKRKWLTGLMSGTTETEPGEKLSDERVYELLCCFSLLSCLKRNVHNLRLIPGPGPYGFRFPYSPGPKENFAFFRFEKDGYTYDVCCGTALMPPNGEPPEHPDISLQLKARSVSDSDRSCGQPLAFWDAKYHSKRSAKHDLQQMNWWCSIFVLPKYRRGDLLSQLLPPTFQISAVITNADAIPFNHSLLLKNRFSIVFGFHGETSGACPTPTRPEHESHLSGI